MQYRERLKKIDRDKENDKREILIIPLSESERKLGSIFIMLKSCFISKIGDLSRFAAKNTSYNLPLSGLNSIKGRSVAVMGQSSVVSCATIDWDVDSWTRVDAKVTYTGEVIGTITMVS